jgi:hypothetical protein
MSLESEAGPAATRLQTLRHCNGPPLVHPVPPGSSSRLARQLGAYPLPIETLLHVNGPTVLESPHLEAASFYPPPHHPAPSLPQPAAPTPRSPPSNGAASPPATRLAQRTTAMRHQTSPLHNHGMLPVRTGPSLAEGADALQGLHAVHLALP